MTNKSNIQSRNN